ncbi:hypothetical protein F8568_044695 [Actinomadura sp. LD22]|uniref:Uncharacterized protein n=1 Tax=Actinomadura physcomitrii TaxID=2650748 RepID=A0A6I4MVH8_9ACTN|nr:hypothetical protein [Actinomadura physcomitrii]MWA07311.1 hypothetical protein [Actinomadura physcomitrii]
MLLTSSKPDSRAALIATMRDLSLRQVAPEAEPSELSPPPPVRGSPVS